MCGDDLLSIIVTEQPVPLVAHHIALIVACQGAPAHHTPHTWEPLCNSQAIYGLCAPRPTSAAMAAPGGAELDFFDKFAGGLKKVSNVLEAGAKTVATGVTNVANSLLLDSDLERIKSINEFAKSQTAVGGRKQLSEQEMDAADKKADAVLAKCCSDQYFLPPQSFDPVRHELQQLSNEAGQEEIDQVVDRLAVGVEVGGGNFLCLHDVFCPACCSARNRTHGFLSFLIVDGLWEAVSTRAEETRGAHHRHYHGRWRGGGHEGSTSHNSKQQEHHAPGS